MKKIGLIAFALVTVTGVYAQKGVSVMLLLLQSIPTLMVRESLSLFTMTPRKRRTQS